MEPSDTAARYGGEEFACILPVTGYTSALKLAEEIRAGVEGLGIPHAGSGIADHVTVSLGVLTIDCNKDTLPQEIVENCDKLLYQAKKKGRNTVVGQNLSGSGGGRS